MYQLIIVKDLATVFFEQFGWLPPKAIDLPVGRGRQLIILLITVVFERVRMNIYVGNVSYRMTEDELKAAFEAYGEVESARVITDRETGRSKGFAFVEMPDSDQAHAAIEALNGSEIAGRQVTVNEARPRTEGGGGFRGGRGPRNF